MVQPQITVILATMEAISQEQIAIPATAIAKRARGLPRLVQAVTQAGLWSERLAIQLVTPLFILKTLVGSHIAGLLAQGNMFIGIKAVALLALIRTLMGLTPSSQSQSIPLPNVITLAEPVNIFIGMGLA